MRLTEYLQKQNIKPQAQTVETQAVQPSKPVGGKLTSFMQKSGVKPLGNNPVEIKPTNQITTQSIATNLSQVNPIAGKQTSNIDAMKYAYDKDKDGFLDADEMKNYVETKGSLTTKNSAPQIPTLKTNNTTLPTLDPVTGKKIQSKNDMLVQNQPFNGLNGLQRTGLTVLGGAENLIGKMVNSVDVASKSPANPMLYAMREYNDLFWEDGTKKIADYFLGVGETNLAKAKEGASDSGQFAVDLGAAGTELAGTIGIGIASGGGALVPMAMSAFGGAAKEAEKNGASYNEQYAYGTLSAGTAVLLEGLSNAGILSKAFGKGATDDVVIGGLKKFLDKYIASDAGKAVATKLGTMVVGGAGEGLEEVFQDAVAPILQKVTYARDQKLFGDLYNEDTVANAFRDFGLGAILGGIAGGVNVNTPNPTTNVQPVNTQPQITPNLNTSQQAVQTPTITPNVQISTDTAKVENANTPQIKVYRGYNRSDNPTEQNLAKQQTIFDVLGKPKNDTQTVPLSFYTESESDAKSYADMDVNLYSQYKEMASRDYNRAITDGKITSKSIDKEQWITNRANEIYKTMTGKDAPIAGYVQEHTISPKNTLDLTELGETTTVDDIYSYISKKTGIPETEIDDKLLFGDMSESTSDPISTFKILRNVGNTDSGQVGTRFVKLMQELGFDAVRYSESGTNHYAVLNESKPATNKSSLFPLNSLGANLQQTKQTLPQGLGATSNSFVPEQKVSKVFTNTFQKTNSITDEQRAQMKPEDYQYNVRGKALNETMSQQRIENDYAGEVADLNSKQQWTDEDVFTAEKILKRVSDEAEKSGNFEEFNRWTKSIQKRGTNEAQSLNAFKVFQKTPEGAVIKAQQVIEAVEKKITTKKENGKDVDTKKGRQVKDDSEKTKEAVKSSAKESVQSVNPANVAVEWWIRDTSKSLASRIDSNSKDKNATKSETTMQSMLNDLVRITKGAAPQGDSTKIKTNLATNTLRNYWANSEQYQAAVQRAQRYINEQYANNPEALAIFNDWLSGSGISTWKLLGKSLQENGVKYNDILMSSWQDKAKLLDKVTAQILKDTDLTEAEATQAANYISDKFYDELAIRAQKKIEQLLKPSTPKQQKTMYQRINEFVNAGVFDDSAITTLVKEKYGIPNLTTADVQKIYELNKLAQETTDEYQKSVFENRAARIMADKMPVTGKDKVLAVRRIAMLLNPKTLISRNAGGNVIFGLLEDIKDAPGTLIDLGVSKITGQRSTSYNPFATAKAEFIGAKKGLTEWGKDIKNKVDTSPTQHEMPQAPALKSTVGKGFESALNKLLQLGDRPFYEAAKAKRLDELKRLGLDYTSEDAIAQANVYALERVFQNNSELAKKAMELRDSLGVVGDIAIPFAQTPANIFDKLADYSPYGFVRAIKKAGTIKDSAWSQKQFVDTLSRSMTGTGILAFAYFAAQAGLISGGENKEEDEALTYQKKISGWQPYSIRVGDKSYTYDWTTVVGALLSLGADISQSETAGDTLMAILMNGAKAGINTMFNQSYMEGVAELLSSRDGIAGGLENMLVGLPASFTPTAFQQIAKIIDPIARDTYDTDPFKRSWNKVKAKLPYLSQTLPAKIGADGKEIKNFDGGKSANIIESLLSPGYVGENAQSRIDKEVSRIYGITGDTSVLPNWSAYTSKGDLYVSAGENYTLTTEEWEQYQKNVGDITYDLMQDVIDLKTYGNMSTTQKAELLSDAVSYATYKAKLRLSRDKGGSYSNTTWDKVYEAEQNGVPFSWYIQYKINADINGNGSVTQDEAEQAINSISGINNTQKAYVWSLQNSSWSQKNNPYR